MMSRKKTVQVHLKADAGQESFEGIYLGRRNGHYILELSKLLTSNGVTELDGRAEIPRENVLFIQRLER